MPKKATSKAVFSPVHDLFVKDVILAIPGCWLVLMQLVLSALEYSWFDWKKAKFTKDTFVDPQGRELRADIVCQVPLTAHARRMLPPAWRKKIKNFKFIVLLEHKAQNAPQVCQQLTQMLLSLSTDETCIVLPVVVYHGKEPWTAPRSLHALLRKTNPLFQSDIFYKSFAKNVPNFEYRLLDLNKMSEKQLAAKGLTYEAFPYTLKDIWLLKEHTEQVLGRVLSKAEKMPFRQHKIFLKKTLYYFESKYPNLLSKEIVMKTAVRVQAKKTAQKAMTLEDFLHQQKFEEGMERGIEKGLEQGLEKGVQKGRQEGRQAEQQAMIRFMLKKAGVKEIARLTGLSVQKIQKLKKTG